MTGEFDPGILRRLNQFVTGCSVLATSLGAWVLIGWMLHIPRMKTILAGQVAVKANTGACFLLVGFALWVLRREKTGLASNWRLAAKMAAVIISVVGLLSLLEFAFGWDLGVDQLLFRAGAEDIPGSVRPGLMSPLTALGFLGMGITLVLLDARSRLARWSLHLLSCGVAIASLFGILDFALDASTTHTYISPITAIVLFVFSFAVMFARTHSGLGALVASVTYGGTLTRRLLPSGIFVPLVIGWLRWKGELAGDLSQWSGVTLMVVLCAVLLASLTTWTASVIDRIQREREQTEQARNASEERLRLLLDGVKDYAIYMLDPGGLVVSWNAGAQAVQGYRAKKSSVGIFPAFTPPRTVSMASPARKWKKQFRWGASRNRGCECGKTGLPL